MEKLKAAWNYIERAHDYLVASIEAHGAITLWLWAATLIATAIIF